MFSLGVQGRESLHCMLAETGDSRYQTIGSRSDLSVRSRIGLSEQWNPSLAYDGYSSEATVTAASTSKRPLRQRVAGKAASQRKKGEPIVTDGKDVQAKQAYASGESLSRTHLEGESVVHTHRLLITPKVSINKRPRSPEQSTTHRSPEVSEVHHSGNQPRVLNELITITEKLRNAAVLSNVNHDYAIEKSSTPMTKTTGRSLLGDHPSESSRPGDGNGYLRTGSHLSDCIDGTHSSIPHTARSSSPSTMYQRSTMASNSRTEIEPRFGRGETTRPYQLLTRRLSGDSSCGSNSIPRPKLRRNFSGEMSSHSRLSNRFYLDSEESVPMIEWDRHSSVVATASARSLRADSVGRSSNPDSEWPLSPLSEDDLRTSDLDTVVRDQKRDKAVQPDHTVLPAVLLALRLLAVVPATVGSLAIIWSVSQQNLKGSYVIANHLAALPWAALTGIFCFELTSGLTQRWLVHYALAPTLLRLVSLQSLCWPCTYLTLRYVGGIDILLAWIVVCTTTACSRSIQIWVTSNVPDPGQTMRLIPSGTRATLSSAIMTFIGLQRVQDTSRGTDRSDDRTKERIWDWKEIGQLVWFPLAILYALTTWFLLWARHSLN